MEVAGIGPIPFAGMVLADMGADVIRIDRPEAARSEPAELPHMARGRRSIAIDLKREEGRALALAGIDRADILIEGHRPGVMERLGLGPDVCLDRNPRLVYGRMTGWGQIGPLSSVAGHDVNYISVAGVAGAVGPAAGPPVIPLNLVGDFGGGAMLLVTGVLLALFERSISGCGQVVDAAMVDGASLLMTLIHQLAAEGRWSEGRGRNLLDGGAPFYAIYETADGRHVSVGAIEPQFFAQLMETLGLDFDLGRQNDPVAWPQLRELLAGAFRRRTRDEWVAVFDGSDACVTPVLDLAEATSYPHAVARKSFLDLDGRMEPAPAPRLSRTPGAADGSYSAPGADSTQILRDWLGPDAIVESLLERDVVVQRGPRSVPVRSSADLEYAERQSPPPTPRGTR